MPSSDRRALHGTDGPGLVGSVCSSHTEAELHAVAAETRGCAAPHRVPPSLPALSLLKIQPYHGVGYCDTDVTAEEAE